jgi:hypothetical protein
MFNKHVFFPRFIDSDALLSLGEQEIKAYVDDVAVKGFNGIRAKLIWIKPSSGPYAARRTALGHLRERRAIRSLRSLTSITSISSPRPELHEG